MNSRVIFRGRGQLTALICAAVAALAGCGSIGDKLNPFSWFGSSGGVKPAELREIKATLTFSTIWRATIGASGQFAFVPAVTAETVYAAGENGTLGAFDAATGSQKWRIDADKAGLSAGVGAFDNTIVVASVKGDVLAFDSKGVAKWRAQVSSEVLAPPLVTAAAVFVRSNDNRIYAFAPADGKRLWVYERTSPALILRSFGGMSASSEAVYAGFPGGRLVALDSANGTLRWEGTVALPKGATELERIADVTSSPVISTRDVCAVAYQGRAACFDITNGQQLWTRDMSSFMGLAYDGRYVFVSDEKSALVALARTTGSSQWKQDLLAYRTLSTPLSLGRAVVAGDYQGVIHAFSREDGTLIGRTQTDGSAITAPPVPFAGAGRDIFYIQTRSGGLFAFSL